MEIIREIIRVATSHASSSVRIMDPNVEQNALNHYLFHGIKEDQFETDDDAARALFGTDASDKRYTTLRARFSEWMVNTLFHLHIKQPEFTPFQEALYQCNRRIFLAKTLASFGARSSSSWFARRVLTRSQRYDLTSYRVQALELLREHASLTGSEKDFEGYCAEMHEAADTLMKEMRTDEYLYRIYLHFSRSSEVDSEIRKLAAAYVKEAGEIYRQRTTRTIALNYFRLRSIQAQIEGNYADTIEVCGEVEQYFEENPRFASKTRLAEFLLLKMTSYFYLRDFEAGSANAEASIAFFKKGTYNWYIFVEYYFLLAMHTANYVKAADIFREVVYHQSFQSQALHRIEKWRIFEAYLRYALEISGQEDALDPKSSLMARKFSLYKYLNDTPEFDEKQRGRNTAILSIQILFLLEREDLDILRTRAAELDRYASKHLRKEDNYRSNCFLRMIRVTVDKEFDYTRIEQLGRKYIRKLNATPLVYDGSFNTLEVIPYQTLWKRVLENLQNIESVALAPEGEETT